MVIDAREEMVKGVKEGEIKVKSFKDILEGDMKGIKRIPTENTMYRLSGKGVKTGEVFKGEELYIKEKDKRLKELISGIHEGLKEVNEIIQYSREVKNIPDMIIHDLNHILEIENLTKEGKVKLEEGREKVLKGRREIKNIGAIDNMLGESFLEWYRYLDKRMQSVMGVLVREGKYYRIKTKEAVKMYEEITGRSIESTDGKYFDASDFVDKETGKYNLSDIKKYKKEEKKRKEIEKEKKGNKPLRGKKFEVELSKAVGKRKRKGKKKRKKTL